MSGWMSIEVDGERRNVAGGSGRRCSGVPYWRATSTVIASTRGSRSRYGQQVYSFALMIDGALQPGSDPQPEPGKLKRQTLIAIGWLTLVTASIVATTRILARTM